MSMKKIIFTLALSLAIFSASAYRGSSEINLKLYDNSVFSVIFDNVPYNYYTSSYNFESVSPGSHFITVMRNQSYGYYSVPVTLFSGYVYIPVNVKMFSMINMYGSFVTISQSPLYAADDTYNDDIPIYNTDYNDAGWGSYGNYYNGSYGNSYTDFSPCMSQLSFMSLVSSVSNATFESSKIKIASEAISLNYMTSSQVLMLLNCFTFESSKLEIAKLAYAKVIDKENFFKVNNAFTFDSSIDELCEFISGS
jgi:hypothetical protein